MPASPIVQFLYFLTVAISMLAIWKGALPERLGGAIILANVAIGRISHLVLPPDVDAITSLSIDGATAVGLLAVTMIHPGPWLGAVMLLYAAQFALHSFYSVTERPHDLLHSVFNNLDFLLISVCLGAGVGDAWVKRLRRRARRRRAAPPDRRQASREAPASG